MKTAWNELRIFLAEKLLTWAMYAAPNNAEGETFVRSGVAYFEKAALMKTFGQTDNGE